MKSINLPHGSRQLGWLRNGNPPCDLASIPRCQAKAKSTGRRCGNVALKGKRVCRIHGGLSPGKKGNKNAMKDGAYTAEAITKRKNIKNQLADYVAAAEKLKETKMLNNEKTFSQGPTEDNFAEYYKETSEVTCTDWKKYVKICSAFDKSKIFKYYLSKIRCELSYRVHTNRDRILCIILKDECAKYLHSNEWWLNFLAEICELDILVDKNNICEASTVYPTVMFIAKAKPRKAKKPTKKEHYTWKDLQTGAVIGTHIVEKNRSTWIPGVEVTA